MSCVFVISRQLVGTNTIMRTIIYPFRSPMFLQTLNYFRPLFCAQILTWYCSISDKPGFRRGSALSENLGACCLCKVSYGGEPASCFVFVYFRSPSQSPWAASWGLSETAAYDDELAAGRLTGKGGEQRNKEVPLHHAQPWRGSPGDRLGRHQAAPGAGTDLLGFAAAAMFSRWPPGGRRRGHRSAVGVRDYGDVVLPGTFAKYLQIVWYIYSARGLWGPWLY